MEGMVSGATIGGMVVSMIVAIVYPIALLIYWKSKQKPRWASFFIGAATFALFALVLEQILHVVVMTGIGGGDMNAGSVKMSSNIWLYGLYGGACAAIFEEFGRLLAMKFCMKKYLDKKNAIMYGIGHGGIESIIILGIAEISNIATALAVNSGAIELILAALPEDQKAMMREQIAALWTTPSASFYLAGVERIIAVMLHICLSYMVYRYVKYNEKKSFAIALGVHFLVDFATVIIGQMLSIAAVEVILAVAIVVFLVYVVKKYRNENEDWRTELE